MSLPNFLDIELSTPDDGAYPTQISWSLDDGKIKTAIIIPDDDWEPWYNRNPELDVQYLIDAGSTPSEIIRELNEDLSGKTVFYDGLDEDEQLIEMLFDASLSEPDFELAKTTELFLDKSFETILENMRDISLSHNFDLGQTEDTVRAMLFMYAEGSD